MKPRTLLAAGLSALPMIFASTVNLNFKRPVWHVSGTRLGCVTVDKFTGDGIMAVFDEPVALEDRAVRACVAALGVLGMGIALFVGGAR
jgi:class 3 adenylate cyclase